MPIYFITGNKNKFEEVKSVIPQVLREDIDLPEIQEIDAKKIIQKKIESAFEYKDSEFIVEDTSLYLECLKGLPGPLIKWFMKTLGNRGIADLAERLGNNNATAKTVIGYAKKPDEIYFFEGETEGKIVKPSDEGFGWGWDPIFVPEGYKTTFHEMLPEEKNKISMRKKALDKLKEFMDTNKEL